MNRSAERSAAARAALFAASVAASLCACSAPASFVPPDGGSSDAMTVGGLTAAAGGTVVYDANQGIVWLADANLASKQTFGVGGINDSGSMTYDTATHWVAAMNDAGYLDCDNWQLPVTPPKDNTCSKWSGSDGNSFGSGCTKSALGHLFYEGLGESYPDNIDQLTSDRIGPFENLQPAIYWTNHLVPDAGQATFSFSNGIGGANTTPNYFYVWPMVRHAIGTPPAGTGLVSCCDGGGVYDWSTGNTWLANANQAATQNYGFGANPDGGFPLIAPDGAMTYDMAAPDGGFFAAMNAAAVLGATDWHLPDGTNELQGLYTELGYSLGDSIFTTTETTGPFHDLQPYLYWSCERAQGGDATWPCQDAGPSSGFEWSVNFGSGFQGTDLTSKELYVMVYFPNSLPTNLPPPHCSTEVCCVCKGGTWAGGRCQ